MAVICVNSLTNTNRL